MSNHARHLNEAVANTGYKTTIVSWEDCERSVGFGYNVSSTGPNITDVTIAEKNGMPLYTLRKENWNETIALVPASDVLVVVGNHAAALQLETVSLQKYLEDFSTYGAYAGVVACKSGSLYAADKDEKVKLRFQAVFIPRTEAGAMQFCTSTYNYQTRSADVPRNQLLLVTPQGTSAMQDRRGKTHLFYHAVDADAKLHQYWLAAEKTRFEVGQEQSESAEEMREALSAGKSTAVSIGVKAMANCMNTQMLVQIPIRPDAVAPRSSSQGFPPQPFTFDFATSASAASASASINGEESDGDMGFGLWDDYECCRTVPRQRTACVARVSYGDEVDAPEKPIGCRRIKRDEDQHITITITEYYYTMADIPMASDVRRAVARLDQLYESCRTSKTLSDHAKQQSFKPKFSAPECEV